ncbi:MAG TPA: protein-methionine-sulfoxide reductase heme-binding subunit MsrQ [Bryobacteraceae bacterium]|nr:protein-methionine-sulfoxide reductase heme-binding subunit MsrQ [Bryobacteraceae bacterium]
MKRVLLSRWTKVVVFLVCLVPLGDLGWQVYKGALANPVEYITHTTGDWIIRFLLITLSITPLRMLLNQPQLTRFRRMFGLFAFFYGLLHFTTWFWLDKALDFSEMGKDILKRPFITAGMTGLALMIPLAITSTAGWVRRLGFNRWQALHRLVYVSATAGVIHYYWLVKSDIRLPVMYGAILTVLLGYRVVVGVRKGARVSAVKA